MSPVYGVAAWLTGGVNALSTHFYHRVLIYSPITSHFIPGGRTTCCWCLISTHGDSPIQMSVQSVGVSIELSITMYA